MIVLRLVCGVLTLLISSARYLETPVGPVGASRHVGELGGGEGGGVGPGEGGVIREKRNSGARGYNGGGWVGETGETGETGGMSVG